jgi:hypothetical protein
MKIGTHIVLQVLGIIISFGTILQSGTYIPMKYVPFVVLVVSAAQGLLGWIGHYYTPSGTKIV